MANGGAVDVMIFTKDRPAQLDLLLRSIEEYSRDLYRHISIQWRTSSPEYERGYARLYTEMREQGMMKPWTRDYDATSFREHVRAWLRGGHEWVSFLVDDDVFYRRPERQELVDGLSLRGGDYDYPFSVDGVIYRRETIEDLLLGIPYGNPSQLEAWGHDHRERLPFSELTPGTPCLTGLPWNRVSESSGMPELGHHPYDLNERWLDGERLALPVFAVTQPPHSTAWAPVWELETQTNRAVES